MNSTISLTKARQITGLPLVSAKNEWSFTGRSYHEMEREAESPYHRAACKEGIELFTSFGYSIYPDGVGVEGTFALADFLAVRSGRTVFVEVLSDRNLSPSTLRTKAQLQQHGELCFILYAPNKKEISVEAAPIKAAIEQWADVLYCRLSSYSGSHMEERYRASVFYDTKRDIGVRVSLSFAMAKRVVTVTLDFITQMYDKPWGIIRYPSSYLYETTYRSAFYAWAAAMGASPRRTAARPDKTSIRAMRRPSGLSMVHGLGRKATKLVVARLRSEYVGPPIEKTGYSDGSAYSRDVPSQYMRGVFILERTGQRGLTELVTALKQCNLTVEWNDAEYQAAMAVLAKQNVPIQTD